MDVQKIDLLKIISETPANETIRVGPGLVELPDKTEFIKSIQIIFEENTKVVCNCLQIIGCTITFTNMNYDGYIKAFQSIIEFNNCKFTNEITKVEYIIDADLQSLLTCSKCTFENISKYTLLTQNLSSINCVDTVFKNCKLSVIHNNFKAEFVRCNFLNTQESFIFNHESSLCVIDDCIFDTSTLASILNIGTMTVQKTTFRNSNDTQISCFNDSELFVRDCIYESSKQTSLFINDSNLEVHNCQFRNIDGNCINIIHCDGTISDCTFENSTYPHISMAIVSNMEISNCSFVNSPSSCVMCRGGSTLVIKNCSFNGTERFGLATCDGKIEECTNCIFKRCKHACVASFDNGMFNISDSKIIGPTEVGIEVFCGGNLIGSNLDIGKAEIASIRTRFGGSINLTDSSLEKDSKVILQGRNFMINNVKNTDDIRIENLEKDPVPRCFKCGKDCSQNLFDSCGHACFCRECCPPKGECPLCHLDYETAIIPHPMSTDKLCGICMEEEADSILIPCGHLICKKCFLEWYKQDSGCPYCRHKFVNCRSLVPYA